MAFDIFRGIYEAGEKAVGAVADAVKSATDAIWGGSPPKETPPPQVTDPNDPSAPESPVPTIEEAPEVVKNDPNNSLWQEMHLLKVEAMGHAEKKVRTAYEKVKALNEKTKLLTNVLQHITANPSQDGSYEIKDDETKKLFSDAINVGLNVTRDKHSFSKEEKDTLLRNIELLNRNLDTDIKLATNEVQEGLHTRNTYYQELKTMWDKIIEAVKKILGGIAR